MLVSVIGLMFLLVGGFELSGNRVQPLQRDGVSAYSILMLVGMVGIGFGVWYAFGRQPDARNHPVDLRERPVPACGNEVEACGWEDVKDFRTAENLHHPIYVIVTRGDCRLILSAEQSPAIMPLAEYLKVKIASAQLLPKLHRIFDGDPVKFGAIWLDSAGIKGAVMLPLWSQIVVHRRR